MKNISAILVLLVCQISLLCSCMGDKEIVTTPECAILSFSVGDIKSQVSAKYYRADGTPYDTIVTRTIGGKGIYFNIDQIGGRIYGTDSLPNWTNLTRVCPSFTAYGSVFVKQHTDSLFYPITSGSDSIDLSKPAQIIAIATDGQTLKQYTLEMYKSSGGIDTLEWKKIKAADDTNVVFGTDKPTALKALCREGGIYVYYHSEAGELMLTSARIGEFQTPWHITKVQSAEGSIDSESIVAVAQHLLALNSEGHICTSTDGALWTVACTETFDQLVGADDYYVYAMADGKMYHSADMQTWAEQSIDDADRLPLNNKYLCSYPSRTNGALRVSVLLGTDTSGKSVSWYKLSSLDDDADQSWAYIQMTSDNSYPMPQLAEMTACRYNGALWMAGISGAADKPAYSVLYRSDDNGISWRPQTTKYALPENLKVADGQMVMVATGNDIVIVQANGNVWQGCVR